MFRQLPYGTDDLPGGSDGVETHTFRTKPALSREMDRTYGTERDVGRFTPD
jgi:hypothetical protein